MLFLIFYLQYFVLGEDDPPVSELAEVCVEGSKFCDYQPVGEKEQILPRCGKHFASIKDISKIGLSEWLIREIFCLRKYDKDNYISKNDPNSTSTNDSKDDKSSKNRQVIKKPASYPENVSISTSKSIKETNEEPFFIPAPFLASSACGIDIREIDTQSLTPIDSLKCYYKKADYNNISDLFSKYEDDHSTCNKDGYYLKSIKLSFIYDSSNLVINKKFKQCEYHNNDNDNDDDQKEYYIQVSAHFYNEESYPNGIVQKSGEAGYSDGKPVIAYHNAASVAASQFPTPFGYKCSDISYTPLLFGYDTISGCKFENDDSREKDIENIIQKLKDYPKVAKMGKARGKNDLDWVEISGIDGIDKCTNLQLIINYEYVGNTKNPQNRIYNASYNCRSTEGNNFLFLVNFLRSSDDSSKAFIPKPKGLPDDTFAPLIN